jgi:hypothetical protein
LCLVLLWSRHHTQLLHKAKVIHQDPGVGDLPIGEAIDHHALHLYLITGGRYTQKVTPMSTAPRKAVYDFIPFGNQLLDGPLLVREGGKQHPEYPFEALTARLLAGEGIQFDNVFGDQLVCCGQVLLVYDLFYKAAFYLSVLFHRHISLLPAQVGSG